MNKVLNRIFVTIHQVRGECMLVELPWLFKYSYNYQELQVFGGMIMDGKK